jgi:6,7-dimethyl-8-ribityllumazine synthase
MLLVIADFYQDISLSLREGAESVLESYGGHHKVVCVHGALEVPVAISMAAEIAQYDGYIALGCIIRGETSHYDIVCNESAAGLAYLGVQRRLCVGNGILTVENMEQAIVRANPLGDRNTGGVAAFAALQLVILQEQLRS